MGTGQLQALRLVFPWILPLAFRPMADSDLHPLAVRSYTCESNSSVCFASPGKLSNLSVVLGTPKTCTWCQKWGCFMWTVPSNCTVGYCHNVTTEHLFTLIHMFTILLFSKRSWISDFPSDITFLWPEVNSSEYSLVNSAGDNSFSVFIWACLILGHLWNIFLMGIRFQVGAFFQHTGDLIPVLWLAL